MLARKYRFTHRLNEDFFKSTQRLFSRQFVLFYRKSANESSSAQLAIIIPAKVAKTAVLRNKARRVIGEEIKTILPSLAGYEMALYLQSKLENPHEAHQLLSKLTRS